MSSKIFHYLLVFILGFIALTAIGGGLAILSGLDQFPLEWLDGSLFHSYIIPALLLMIFVGGSAIWALVFLLKDHPYAWQISALAGWIMMFFITVEVFVLKQNPPGPTDIEIFYFFLGFLSYWIAFVWKKASRGKGVLMNT